MAEFEIGGRKYRTGMMPARRQFHVGRRLLAVFSTTTAALPEAGPDGALDLGALDQNALIAAVGGALGAMTDADADYIIDNCLQASYRLDGGQYRPVWNAQANQPQYQDLTMAEQLALVAAVVRENLSGFLAQVPDLMNAIGLVQISRPSP